MRLEVFMELVWHPDLYTEVSNPTIMILTSDTSTRLYINLVSFMFARKLQQQRHTQYKGDTLTAILFLHFALK